MYFKRLTAPDSMLSINASISLFGAISPEISPRRYRREFLVSGGHVSLRYSERRCRQTLDERVSEELMDGDFLNLIPLFSAELRIFALWKE